MRSIPVPLAIPNDLRTRVAKIARKAKAKQAEVYRLAIRCGLQEAEKRLIPEPERLFPNIEPLSQADLERWYRSEPSKEWDAAEKAATRAQAIPNFDE